MSKLFVLQDSALNQKDMSFAVEKHIRSKNERYQFLHNVYYLYGLEYDSTTDSLIVVHRTLSEDYKTNPNAVGYWKEFNLSELNDYLEDYDNVLIMAIDLAEQTSDKDIISKLDYYHRLENGDIVHCKTKQVVTSENESIFCFNVMNCFRLNVLPINVCILNSNCIQNHIGSPKLLSANGDTLLSSNPFDNVKDTFFSAIPTTGFEEIIGRETVFVNDKTVKFDLYPEHVKTLISENSIPKNKLKSLLNIKTNVPFTTDGLTLTLDMSNVPAMSTAFLKVEMLAHEFFEVFIYESQKSYFEYNLYKMR